MPKSGWMLIGSDDLGDLSGECEYCGTDLRYTYAIIHPSWGAMVVGTDCCDNLTGTMLASEHHEKYLKKMERRKRFVSSKRWKRIRSGGEWLIQEGLSVFILPSANKFLIRMGSVEGAARYDSAIDAKLKAFDFIESGEATAFFIKRGERERRRSDQQSKRGKSADDFAKLIEQAGLSVPQRLPTAIRRK